MGSGSGRPGSQPGLASQYLAVWIIARTQGIEAAKGNFHHVGPVGEKEEYGRVRSAISSHIFKTR
jgi:hypothetical protein